MRYLLKPLVAVLTVGLVGCKTAKYTVVERVDLTPPVPVEFDELRVTLENGKRYELIDARLDADSVRGWGGVWSAARSEVILLEHKYVPVDWPTTEAKQRRYDHLRVSLISGEVHYLSNARVTPRGIYGQPPGAAEISIARGEIASLEKRNDGVHAGKTLGLVVGIGAVLFGAMLAAVAASYASSDWDWSGN
jgi:hypothetical protein